MKKLGIVLIMFSIVCLIGCYCFAERSYDKYTNYYNSETFYARNRNAYVGGDAYNYIINGTYFTAFAVYASACALMGLISLISGGFMVALANRMDELPARSDVIGLQRKLELLKAPARAEEKPATATPVPNPPAQNPQEQGGQDDSAPQTGTAFESDQ